MKTLRPGILLTLLVLLCSSLFAQSPELEKNEVPESILHFFEGLNARLYSKVEPFMSKEFTIEGVPANYMNKVMGMIFQNVGRTTEAIRVKSTRKTTRGTEFTITYLTLSEIGEIDFGLDKEGKIRSCSIFTDRSPQTAVKRNEALRSNAEVKLEIAGGYLLIETELNDEKVTFLINSAEPLMVLNSSFQNKNPLLKMQVIPGAKSTDKPLGMTKIDKLTWGGGVYQNFDVIVKDLSPWEEKTGKLITGVLSINELQAFECLFDYQKQSLTLYGLKPDGNVFESLKAPLPKHKLNFELLAFRPLFKIKIGKANLKLVLDTTTQQNLISKSLAKKLKKSLLDARESETEIVGRIASCKLGKLEFGDMTYTLGDVSHLGSQKKLKADGILGRDFLSRMPFSLNFRKRSLSFY